MAMFRKGDIAKVIAIVPEGPVKSMRMEESGNIQYLISWIDINGVEQERWFDEGQLTTA